MRTVHRDPSVAATAARVALAAGLGVAVLVVALRTTTGVTATATTAGIAYGIGLAGLLLRAQVRHHRLGFGPADRVTLTRAVLVGGVTALAVDGRSTPVLVALAAVALVLDNVDGRVARRTGSVSRFGAAFDMEVDAALILVLSVAAMPLVGDWVVAIGLARYAFGGAGLLRPWLRGTVPVRYWRKVVAAVQGVVLTVVVAGVVPVTVATGLAAAAALLLAESFGRDIVGLAVAQWHRPARPAPRPVALAGHR